MTKFRHTKPSGFTVPTALVALLVTSLLACGDKKDGSTGDTTTPSIFISEIHYHPMVGGELGQFVELSNNSKGEIQLQDWCIKGFRYCFAEPTLIAPNQQLVVNASELTGSLSRDGEDLALVDSLGQTIDATSYTVDSMHLRHSDGAGYSLQRKDSDGSVQIDDAWTTALPTPGTSLTESSVAGDLNSPNVFISEINYHPASNNPAETYIEITNSSTSPVDLGGWCLPTIEYCIPVSSSIPPGGVHLVPAAGAAERLPRGSEMLVLTDANGIPRDAAYYEDAGAWPAWADGEGGALHRGSNEFSGLAPGNWLALFPSPGTVNALALDALLPTVDSIEYTISPTPTTPIEIAATVSDTTVASLAYRIGLDGEQTVLLHINDDGTVKATIPPQPAGSLVRFRFVLSNGAVEGTWPRQGDGAQYLGTAVQSSLGRSSTLPSIQWFMPEELHKEARTNPQLHGDEGYPAVFVLDGVVYDNAGVRIKGNQARSNLKKKWKVRLPFGHEWDAGGRLPNNISEFDLMPAATDKSYSREILTSDLQEIAGGMRQVIFPLRVELNGEFFGLYLFGERSNGDWREKYGFSDSTYVWKAERVSRLSASQLVLDQEMFRTYYERSSLKYIEDNDEILRTFMEQLTEMNEDELKRFALESIDIPQVVNAISTMIVAQHPEWEYKNYYVMFDPEDAKWRLVPIDFDLNFGRRFHAPCGALCDDVRVYDWLTFNTNNKLVEIFVEIDFFRALVERRVRTLVDAFYSPGLIENRLSELLAQMQEDARLDVDRWGQVGASQTMAEAQALIINEFLVPKRESIVDDIPTSQPESPLLSISNITKSDDGSVISALVTNREAIAIDVSGKIIDEINGQLPAGSVIPAGESILVLFERAPTPLGLAPMIPVIATRIEG